MKNMEEHFVGRHIDLASAIDSAETVVLAQLTSAGQADPGPPGQAFHYGAKATILRDFHGNLAGQQTMSFSVQRFPDEIAEATPVEGEAYLLFLQRQPDGVLHVIKILPATSENIQRLEESLR
jgi:hypothetical protein